MKNIYSKRKFNKIIQITQNKINKSQLLRKIIFLLSKNQNKKNKNNKQMIILNNKGKNKANQYNNKSRPMVAMFPFNQTEINVVIC